MDQYKTKDIGLAAYLVTKGQALQGYKKENGVTYFIFNGSEKGKKFENEYRFGNSEIPARRFYDAVKQLKVLIYQNNEQSS